MMLSITNNSQVNFKRNDSKERTGYNDSQNTNLLQEDGIEDSFELENMETPPQTKRNPVSKFVRNIILGTALAGGLTAAAPKAQAQQLLDGQVTTEQKQVDPKDASKGTATYYYTNEAVMDSSISVQGKNKRTQKFDRKLLNTYPKMKYSTTNIQPGNSYIYSYTIQPQSKDDLGYLINESPTLKDLSGKKIFEYESSNVPEISMKDRDERPAEGKYTPTPPEDPFFNNPDMQKNIIKKGNRIIKSGKFVDNYGPYSVTTYYTERPVLDSVIVNKPNGETITTRLDRDVDTKSVKHVSSSDSKGNIEHFWLDFGDDSFIKKDHFDSPGVYISYDYTKIKPTKK